MSHIGAVFLSGAVSSLTAGMLGNAMSSSSKAAQAGAMVLFGGLSGGVSSHLAGGSFGQGFSQGIITAGLNHAMHMGADAIKKAQDKGPGDPPGKKYYVIEYKDHQGKSDYIEVAFDLSTNSIESFQKHLVANYGLGLAQAREAAVLAKFMTQVTRVISVYNITDDYMSYYNREISGQRCFYKMSGTAAAFVTSSVYGGWPGVGVGVAFMGGEITYDFYQGWVKPMSIDFSKYVAHYEYSLKNGWLPGK